MTLEMPILTGLVGLVLVVGVVLVLPSFRSYFQDDSGGPGGSVG